MAKNSKLDFIKKLRFMIFKETEVFIDHTKVERILDGLVDLGMNPPLLDHTKDHNRISIDDMGWE